MASSFGQSSGDLFSQEVLPAPADGVSCLAWSPKENALLAGCWDHKLYWWNIGEDGSSEGKCTFDFEAPVLSACFSSDGSMAFGGGGDQTVRAWSLQDGSGEVIGGHDAAVKSLKFSPELQCVVSGSWDKTVKFWDCRQPNPTTTIPCPERVYSMDIFGSLMVVGCAARKIVVYDLQNMSRPFAEMESPMKYQTRCVACFPDSYDMGFAIGSVEGRVAIQYASKENEHLNFTFKCHRTSNQIYAVNDLSFNPAYGTFATTGSDGHFHFWDKLNKTKLHSSSKANNSLSAGQFNAVGNIFAFAASYDWHQGAQGAKNSANKIYVAEVKEEHVKPRVQGK